LSNSFLITKADITKEADISEALNRTQEKFGKLNVTVNCAGIGVAYKTYNFNKDRAHGLDDFIKCQMVNTVGTFNVIRLALIKSPSFSFA